MSSRRVLELVACGEAGAAWSWIDGGPGGRSAFGRVPDVELRGEDLALFDEVEALRRRDPDATWIGWITYDAAAASLCGGKSPPGTLSGACMRRYPEVVTFVDGEVDADALASAWPLQELRATMAPARYRALVHAAQEHIAAGDTYQVNLSQRFEAAWTMSARDLPLAARVARLYGQLRARSPAAMGGLVADGERVIVSNSPETLLTWTRDRIASEPIKGTVERGDAEAFDRERDALLRSAKDFAEHVMIVDLVRNDLGRVAVAGSVKAEPPRLMSLATVHHLVTEVHARPDPSLSLRQAIEALCPAGSITGAPKRRTVEIIDALEGVPRGIYCGALVLLTAEAVQLSVAIRSGIADADGLSVHGGGGITIDSVAEAERLETIAKVRAFAREPFERGAAEALVDDAAERDRLRVGA